jgi:hypothetical protein
MHAAPQTLHAIGSLSGSTARKSASLAIVLLCYTLETVSVADSRRLVGALNHARNAQAIQQRRVTTLHSAGAFDPGRSLKFIARSRCASRFFP